MAATDDGDGANALARLRLARVSLTGNPRVPSLTALQHDATLEAMRRERDDLVEGVRLIVSRLKDDTSATLLECGSRDLELG